MVTRSIIETPYGVRVTYAVNGERLWTEYLPLGIHSEDEASSNSDDDPTWTQRVIDRLRSAVRAA